MDVQTRSTAESVDGYCSAHFTLKGGFVGF